MNSTIRCIESFCRQICSETWRYIVAFRCLLWFCIVLVTVSICALIPQRARRKRAVVWLAEAHQDRITNDHGCGSEVLRFRFTTLQLSLLREMLTKSDDEAMCLVGGIRIGDEWVATHLAEISTENASTHGVSALPSTLHDTLLRLDRHGHVLLAVAHSHPGSGPLSVQESLTDRNAQSRYERAGYKALTAIVSRDGHIKFFANTLRYHLTIQGHGITETCESTYRIES